MALWSDILGGVTGGTSGFALSRLFGGKDPKTMPPPDRVAKVASLRQLPGLTPQAQEAIRNYMAQAEGSPAFWREAGGVYEQRMFATVMEALQNDPQNIQALRQVSLPPEELGAINFAQLLSGQTAEQMAAKQQKAEALVSNLLAQGIPIQEAYQRALDTYGVEASRVAGRMEDLGAYGPATEAYRGEAERVAPEFERLGRRYGAETERIAPELERLGRRFGETTQRIAPLLAGQGEGPEFEAAYGRYYQPFLQRLDKEMRDRHQDVLERHATRGIAGGTPESYDTALLERERTDTMKRGALEARSQALREYREGLEAELRAAGVGTETEQQALLRGLEARGTGTEAERTGLLSGLETRGTGLTAAGERLSREREGLGAGLEARSSAIQNLLQNWERTAVPAMEYYGVPQSSRQQIVSGGATENLGQRLRHAAEMHNINTQRKIAGQQGFMNLIGGGLGAAGKIGAAGFGAFGAFGSAPELKTDIRPAGDEEQALDIFRDADVSRWRYNEEPPGTEHVGTMTTELPDEMLSPDGQGIDIPSYLGRLTQAVKALDKKMGGFESLLRGQPV